MNNEYDEVATQERHEALMKVLEGIDTGITELVTEINALGDRIEEKLEADTESMLNALTEIQTAVEKE